MALLHPFLLDVGAELIDNRPWIRDYQTAFILLPLKFLEFYMAEQLCNILSKGYFILYSTAVEPIWGNCVANTITGASRSFSGFTFTSWTMHPASVNISKKVWSVSGNPKMPYRHLSPSI